MAVIVDNYPDSGNNFVLPGDAPLFGQSFTGDGGTLNSVTLGLQQSGASGNVNVKIYAHSGVYGTSSVPTGSTLATSDNVDITTVSGDTSFTFSGANKIVLANGTYYVLVFEYSGAGSVTLFAKNPGAHAGNTSYKPSDTWTELGTYDLYFTVYKDDPVVVDSYSESNYSGSYAMGQAGFVLKGGQAFTGNGGTLTSAKFYLDGDDSADGNVVVKIYAETHPTAFGTDSVPTGVALATSDNVVASTIAAADFHLVNFTFSGSEKITLVNGTNYVVSVEYSSASYEIYVGYDGTSPSHAGNFCQYWDGLGWLGSSGTDTCFYVYSEPVSVTTTSTTSTSTSSTSSSTSSTSSSSSSSSTSSTSTSSTSSSSSTSSTSTSSTSSSSSSTSSTSSSTSSTSSSSSTSSTSSSTSSSSSTSISTSSTSSSSSSSTSTSTSSTSSSSSTIMYSPTLSDIQDNRTDGGSASYI